MNKIAILQKIYGLEEERRELRVRLYGLSKDVLEAPIEPEVTFEPKPYPDGKAELAWNELLIPTAAILIAGFMLNAGLISIAVAVIWIGIYLAVVDKKSRERRTWERINDPSFKLDCEIIGKENAENKIVAQEKYDRDKKYYLTVLVPEYEAKKETWDVEHTHAIQEINTRLQAIDLELNELYSEKLNLDSCYRNPRTLKGILDYAKRNHLELLPELAIKEYGNSLYEKACRRRDNLYAAAQERRERIAQQNAERRERRYEQRERRRERFEANREERNVRMREWQFEHEEKRRRAIQSQREWQAVKEANEKRRRNGQPELPYPPRYWD